MRIELIHFQITRNCNLRCHFCGQWGKKGAFSDAVGKEMTFEEWKNIINSIKAQSFPLPDIMLWGGEPLVCTYFDELVIYLKSAGFRVGIVTNGVLADRHIEILNEYVDVIYLSIDGDRETHNSIRGEGVYERVLSNLKLLDASKIKIMTVLTKDLKVNEFADEFAQYTIFLHEMIPFENDEIIHFSEKVPANIILRQHGECAVNAHCLSPYKHLHINWNGNVSFCTDFYDYSIGNVREKDIFEIFTGEDADKMRCEISDGKYEGCKHCSWKNNISFYLDI